MASQDEDDIQSYIDDILETLVEKSDKPVKREEIEEDRLQ